LNEPGTCLYGLFKRIFIFFFSALITSGASSLLFLLLFYALVAIWPPYVVVDGRQHPVMATAQLLLTFVLTLIFGLWLMKLVYSYLIKVNNGNDGEP